MDRQQILDLYQWAAGVCFRHPLLGPIDTALVKTIHPRADGEYQVRACRDCVIAMEAIREEAARQAGVKYEPGHAGEALA